MREDVKTFNISGMGCAAGMVAVDLAKDMLRVHKDKYAVVVGTENITLNWYYGNDRSMLVPNCLFRCGSYALLLSNKKRDRQRSKFELLRSVRTTTGANDKSYNVIFTKEDDEGIMGTSLSVELLNVASKAVTISTSASNSGDEDRLDRMHPVFRLVEDDGGAALEDLFGHLHRGDAELLLRCCADFGFGIVECRKAVHEFRMTVFGRLHDIGGDGVGRKHPDPFGPGAFFLAHG